MTKRDRQRRRSVRLSPTAPRVETGNITPLQQLVWRVATTLPEARTIALAGSGGLIARGIVDRQSRDVDLFATDGLEGEQLMPALVEALEAEECEVEELGSSFGMLRLQVHGLGESTRVDIGIQMRLHPPERTEHGAILSLDDLAAGKFNALSDRAAERDYIDVNALMAEYTFTELCELTEMRQPRFDRQRLAAQLRQFRYTPDSFDSDDQYQEIRQRVTEWLEELTHTTDTE